MGGPGLREDWLPSPGVADRLAAENFYAHVRFRPSRANWQTPEVQPETHHYVELRLQYTRSSRGARVVLGMDRRNTALLPPRDNVDHLWIDLLRQAQSVLLPSSIGR